MTAVMEALPPYQYKALGDGEIRVLYVRPARNEDDPIECMLLLGVPNTSRDIPDFDPPESPPPWTITLSYGALSYTWGPTAADGSHLTDTIICEDQALKVTANLHFLLRLIRKRIPLSEPYPPSLKPENHYCADIPMVYPIWIDALCINQRDVQERSQQVRMMYQIYSRALTLLVWLGRVPGNESSLMAEAIEHKESIFSGQEPSPRSRVYEQAIKRLLEQPWFSRRWVLQEYSAVERERCRILFGTAEVGVERFEKAVLTYSPMANSTAFRQGPQQRTLLWNLQMWDQMQCSDPKDLVFSLVHISRRIRGRPFDINYDQSLLNIFRAVAELAVGLPQDDSHMNSHKAGFPSWVPDWWEPPDDSDEDGDSDVIGLLAIATSHLGPSHAKGRKDGLPYWVPDWREPIKYISNEHRQAVENRPGARLFCHVRQHVAKARVTRDKLELEGEIVSTCFPPQHLNQDPSRPKCRCCHFFGSLWSAWSEPQRGYLEISLDKNVIFVPRLTPPRGPSLARGEKPHTAFVLVKIDPHTFEPRCCFSFKQPEPLNDLRMETIRVV